MRRRVRVQCGSVFALLAVAACTGLPRGERVESRGGDVPLSGNLIANPFQLADPDTSRRYGVHLRLSDASTFTPPRPRSPIVQELESDAADRLLERLLGPLPPMAAAPAFRFATRTVPAPRPGITTRGSFAGVADLPPSTGDEPLRVLSTNPRGILGTTSQIAATFSRPMVALSSVPAVPPDVRLLPSQAGEWRWLDPFTLVFEAVGGLPSATRFSVEIPGSMRSLDGQLLGEDVRWSFETPPPSVRHIGSTERPSLVQPILLVRFDQDIDTMSIDARLQIVVDSTVIPLRRLTVEEARFARIDASGADANRQVAVRPETPLPASVAAMTNAVLRVLPGVRSLEGPGLAREVASHNVTLRNRLVVAGHSCGRAEVCYAGAPWVIRFNFPLRQPPDSGRSWIRIEPALPGATVEMWHDHLVILGLPEPGVDYTAHVSPSVATWSGDTLGEPVSLHFEAEPAEPELWLPGIPLAVLPPDRPALYPILTEGADSIHVTIRRVDLTNLAGELERYTRLLYGEVALIEGSELLATYTVPVVYTRGGPGEAVVDLATVLEQSGGHVILTAAPAGSGSRRANRSHSVWIQRGTPVVDIAEDEALLTVRASSWEDGAPLKDVNVELFTPKSLQFGPEPVASSTTDAMGLSRLPVPWAKRGSLWIVVTRHEGVIGLTPSDPFEHHFIRAMWHPALRAHLVFDRPIYQPGDTVRFAGWLRWAAGVGREITAAAEGDSVQFTARGPRGEDIAEGALRIEHDGRLAASFHIPATTNSGRGIIIVRVRGEVQYHQFHIEEVRRPNFDVAIRTDAGPFLPGDRLTPVAQARYFTGGGMPGAVVEWRVGSRAAFYSPPGWRDYRFASVGGWALPMVEDQTHSARTDASGAHRLVVDLDSVRPSVPASVHLIATVTDLDDQSRTASASFLVHPSAVYVGLRSTSRFVREGESVDVEAVVVDIDGRPVTGAPVSISAIRQNRHVSGYETVIGQSSRARCDLRSTTEVTRCTLRNLPSGDYLITATATDTLGRTNETSIPVRVAGEVVPAFGRASHDTLAISLDRDTYAPGDTANVMVEASFRAVSGLLTLRRGGILETVPFNLENGRAFLQIPIHDRHAPNIDVNAIAFGPGGTSASRVEPATVSLIQHRLHITVEPHDSTLAPGARSAIRVTVTDASNHPVVGANLVLTIVDEALLALSPTEYSDPLEDFHPNSGSAVIDHDLRSQHASHPGTARRGRASAITGIVLNDIDGLPVEGAWVEVVGTTIGGWTRADGTYRIDNVTRGKVALRVSSRDYVTRELPEVSVRNGGSVRANFLLRRRWELLSARRTDLLQRRSAALGSRALALQELAVSASIPPPPDSEGQYELRQKEIELRSNFSPVAAFVTNATTGEAGRVEIPVELPDNLTRYRVRVVAAAGDRQAGFGEAAIVANLPIMARPMPPRFLNRGDRFDLRVLVENRSGMDREIDVAVRATNGGIDLPLGRRVMVPAADRIELRFPAVAGAPGEARFQVSVADAHAVSTPIGDAAQVSIPVLTPAATEAFAVYGHLDTAKPVAFPVRLPAGVIPGYSSLEVGFSTTAAHGLRDALRFLIDCYYALPEVFASRIIALTALSSVPAGATPWPSDWIRASVGRDVAALAGLQLLDGGWSLWTSRFDADPFVTVHVANALQRARAFGVDVPDRTLNDALTFLRSLDFGADTVRHRFTPPLPVGYPQQAANVVRAYALHVRSRTGERLGNSAAILVDSAGTRALTADALAFLLPILGADSMHASRAEDVRRELSARVVRSAGTAGVVSPYDAGALQAYATPRRTEALVLAALVADSSRADLVAPLARGLMAHRVRGRWSNTQENAFAVAALADYLSAAESVEPHMTARAWTGARLAGEQEFAGRHDVRHELTIPADSIGTAGDELDVIIAREGKGRLYYRAGFHYTLEGITPAVARGFEVERSYEAIDDPADVRRDANGTWRIRLGARVLVRLRVAAAGPRYHVAVIDHLPAGLEVANPALAGNAGAFSPPQRPLRNDAPDLPWFPREHVNMRSDRFEAFTTRLEAGRRELTYLVLATTPGDFEAPGVRAEEMYAPETFGRSASTRVVIRETANPR